MAHHGSRLSFSSSDSIAGLATPPKYAGSRLTRSDCEAIIQALAECMEEKKPYLKPSVSVDEVAAMIGVPPKQLSQAIHVTLHKNFFDFINSYRVNEAKARIRDEKFRNLTLLAIAYDVGFNSKSVFNEAFKKNAGLTPGEFRRQIPVASA
jgi:AraC-like DNA-binding protein